MKINQKLILGFFSTSLLLGFVSYISIKTNSEIKHSALIVSEGIKQEVQGATDMSLALQETQIAIHELVGAQEIRILTQSEPAEVEINNHKQKIEQGLAKFERGFLLSKNASFIGDVETGESQEKQDLLKNINKNFNLYKKDIHNFITYSEHFYENKRFTFITSTLEKRYKTRLSPTLIKYRNKTEQEFLVQSNKIIEIIKAADNQIIISTIYSLIIAVLTGSLISRSISKPLRQLKVAVEQVGKGEFSTRVDVISSDEVGILANTFNQMIDDLSKTTVAKYYVDRVINSMADTLIVINLDATIVRLNQAALLLLGYTETELIGKSISKILTANFYQTLKTNTLKASCAIANLETVYLTKSGEEIFVSFSATVMQDTYQENQGIVCVAHDITKRKEAEKINNLLVTAVDYAADAIEITNAEAKYEYVNPAFEKVTGYNHSEVLGKTPASLLRSGKHDDAFYQEISQTIASGQIWNGSYVGKRKNGTFYHQEVTISPVSNAAGAITHHVAVKRDITERKQAEEALRQSQANLSALIENTQDAVWSIDPEYRIITFNSNFKQQFFLAYGIELKVGMNIVECLSPELGAIWLENYNCALEGKRFCFEQHYNFGNRSVDIEFSFNPISTEDGKVIGVSAFGRNITEHKQAKERLKKINECFLSFGTDPIENINRLTALFGELLGAKCTLYRRLDKGMLYAVGQWQTPTGYKAVDTAEGHICYDLIQQGSDELLVLDDLPNTIYAQTDLNVMAYQLKTYIGKAVSCGQSVVGALCALYQTNYTPTEFDRQIVGTIAAAIAVEEDRRAMQESLRESEERYALAARAANDGLWDWNLKTNKVYFSPRSKAILGYGEEEMSDSYEEFFQRVHPQDVKPLKAAIASHLEGITSHFEKEYRVLHQDGQYYWILCRGLAVRDAEGNPYRFAGSQTDITQRKQAEAQLLHQAFHDALTGLPNRLLFMERLEYALKRVKWNANYLFAVLFLDLDRFKVINDSLGHAVGDRLLVAISHRLEVCLRPRDTISRLGGDEFAILLEDIKDVSEAKQVADRVQQQLSLPFYLGGQEVFTTASIGIAISHDGYEQPDDLLRDADMTMYHAKGLGKARYEVFNRVMHQQAMARLQLENDLRRALERHELQVYYQPIVLLNNGKIAGFEALVRWQHPQRGFISPVEFIPLAEETGLIIPLGWCVLQQACQQMRRWLEQFPLQSRLTVSVNISSKQFAQPNLVQKIQQILRETGLPATHLKLEITESVLIDNTEAAVATLKQLKALGIGLSIDDFGTGYSSLSYLHRMPIDTLKIDRSFVNHVDCDPEKIEIIRTIVDLAWNLGMSVVAEGVETKKQMYQLQGLRSEFAQGYFFSKPVDSKAAEALISSAPVWVQDLQLAAN